MDNTMCLLVGERKGEHVVTALSLRQEDIHYEANKPQVSRSFNHMGLFQGLGGAIPSAHRVTYVCKIKIFWP